MKMITKVCVLSLALLTVLPATSLLRTTAVADDPNPTMVDYDPLVDNITVAVTVSEIRALDSVDTWTAPDFYLKVTINGETFRSPTWRNSRYLQDLNWSASAVVPKNEEFVNITMQLWDASLGIDKICDISGPYGLYGASLQYSIKTGTWANWNGDDCLEDFSGFGRLNGCDDNTILIEDRDCELFFDITQNDYDGDGLPYWVETAIYKTDPEVSNLGEDADNDGLPIEYEHHWGCLYSHWGDRYYWIYHPFYYENHTAQDPDRDGLNTIEEYRTSPFGSDPYRQDMFIEIDQMEPGPDPDWKPIPTATYDIIRDVHARHNIYWHVDDGRLGGGEVLPFDNLSTGDDLQEVYWRYFMHENASNWRRGVFRYLVVGNVSEWAKGFVFGSEVNDVFAVDSIFLSRVYHDGRTKFFPLISGLVRGALNPDQQRVIVYVGAIMHETGHTLNIQAPGVDCHTGVWPWQPGYWRYQNYKSVMNYRYIYNGISDYSDGTHGRNDYDDWAHLDLTYFNPRTGWF